MLNFFRGFISDFRIKLNLGHTVGYVHVYHGARLFVSMMFIDPQAHCMSDITTWITFMNSVS